MKSRVVSIEEIKKDNPTLCLSPRRFLGECHNCPVFKREMKKQRHQGLTTEEIIRQIKCHPRIDSEYLRLEAEKSKLLKQLQIVNKKIEEL